MTTERNPYLPPAALGPPRRKIGHARLKYFYLASLCAPFVFALLGLVAKPLAPVLGVLTVVAMLAAPVSYYAWLARTWSLLPERDRAGTSEAAAVLYHFIPGYNAWWIFACNLRIASSFERSLRRYPTRLRAPTLLAWVVPALAILGFVVVVFSVAGVLAPSVADASPAPGGAMAMMPLVGLLPFVWFAWMVRTDNCSAELRFQRATRRAANKTRPAAASSLEKEE